MNGNMKVKIQLAAFVLLLAGLFVLVGAPLALADDDASAPRQETAAMMRPLSDWLDMQGTFCVDDGAGGCILFEPPAPNYLAWTDPARNRIGSYDYAGLANQYIVDQGGASLGTTISGALTEVALPDGRATVTVDLMVKNALTWVSAGVDFGGPALFGYRPAEVLAGADAALCNGKFKLKFNNTAPGAAMPDFMQLAFAPEPGQEILQIIVECTARGDFRALYGVPEGTPGQATILQKAKVIGGGLTFVVEDVTLREQP